LFGGFAAKQRKKQGFFLAAAGWNSARGRTAENLFCLRQGEKTFSIRLMLRRSRPDERNKRLLPPRRRRKRKTVKVRLMLRRSRNIKRKNGKYRPAGGEKP
jgi:hypothetical protein